MEGGADQDYRLVHAIKQYWFIRGLLNLGHRVTVEAVANSDGQTTNLARCKALWVAGQICSFMGRYDEAQQFLQEASRRRALGDAWWFRSEYAHLRAFRGPRRGPRAFPRGVRPRKSAR
jgi:hypothetical protein